MPAIGAIYVESRVYTKDYLAYGLEVGQHGYNDWFDDTIVHENLYPWQTQAWWPNGNKPMLRVLKRYTKFQFLGELFCVLLVCLYSALSIIYIYRRTPKQLQHETLAFEEGRRSELIHNPVSCLVSGDSEYAAERCLARNEESTARCRTRLWNSSRSGSMRSQSTSHHSPLVCTERSEPLDSDDERRGESGYSTRTGFGNGDIQVKRTRDYTWATVSCRHGVCAWDTNMVDIGDNYGWCWWSSWGDFVWLGARVDGLGSRYGAADVPMALEMWPIGRVYSKPNKTHYAMYTQQQVEKTQLLSVSRYQEVDEYE